MLSRTSLAFAFGLAAAVTAFAPQSAFAFGGAAGTPAGDAFAEVCVGNGFGGFQTPGYAANNGGNFGPYGSAPFLEAATCTVAPGAGVAPSVDLGTVSGSGVNGTANYSNTATASASAGLIHVGATNNGSTSTQFAGGMGQAGFSVSTTPTVGPFLAIGNGATGTITSNFYQEVTVHIDGTLTVTGPGALAQFGLVLYAGGSPITDATAMSLFDANNADYADLLGGAGYQAAGFTLNNGASSGTTTDMVNTTVEFFVPMTIGNLSDIGVFATAQAGEGANGASGAPDNSAISNFIYTASWGGTGGTYSSNGQQTSASPSFSNDNGFNFTSTYTDVSVPEPASLALLASGVAALVGARRRKRG